MAPAGSRYRNRGRKALAQHWLVDGRYLRRIVDAADIRPDDTVIEVGAGSGLLTERLAAVASRLIAIEVDSRLAGRLEERLATVPVVTVVAADVLAVKPQELLQRCQAGPPYVVVGNLPFYIGTAIVRHFLRAEMPPRWLLVSLQAEVAENVCAAPGRMSILSVEMQYYARPRLLFRIPSRAFRPPPKVAAAVVRLETRAQPAVAVDDADGFFRLVQAGFAAPRKQVGNSLALGLRVLPAQARSLLAAVGIDPQQRAQRLSIEQWADLYRAYRQAMTGSGQ